MTTPEFESYLKKNIKKLYSRAAHKMPLYEIFITAEDLVHNVILQRITPFLDKFNSHEDLDRAFTKGIHDEFIDTKRKVDVRTKYAIGKKEELEQMYAQKRNATVNSENMEEKIKLLMSKLPKHLQTTAVMSLLENKTDQEIASVLNKAISTINNQLVDAKKHLQHLIHKGDFIVLIFIYLTT
jgi:RNA polymerase sigma factor (sigma-70 family)